MYLMIGPFTYWQNDRSYLKFFDIVTKKKNTFGNIKTVDIMVSAKWNNLSFDNVLCIL